MSYSLSAGKQKQDNLTLQRMFFLHYCINNCSSAKQVDLSAPFQVLISMFAAEGHPWELTVIFQRNFLS